ncbi:MAG: hypothetical protein QOH90_186 [Actinomycetota bacterium]|nr:hypothetical protein [Actinomycetota bacterium]
MSSIDASASAAPQPRERRPWTFVRLVTLLITVVSILGAIVAWRASVVSGNAGGLDQTANQDLVRKQQIDAQIEAQVDEDLRIFPRYLAHLGAWKTLKQQSDDVRAQDPDLATKLSIEGQDELSLARTLYQSLSVKPVFGAEEYDKQFSVDYLRQFEIDLRGLDPDKTVKLAAEERERGVKLVGITALFIASLFFLTLAQVARFNVRRFFALGGLIILIVGTILFVAVDVL